ncbi:MAG: aminotransferase class V-fold PLP-dependent enzyme [Methylovulum sp.]
MKTQTYLDYAATTPMAPEAIAAMAQCLTMDGEFANPASLQHGFGERANALVEKSRSEIAHLLKCKAQDLIFTSGATESNNLAIKGIALRYQNKGNHIITSASEHKAVLDTCRYCYLTNNNSFE